MTFPILEYDPEREALINPRAIATPQPVPACAVLCFFHEVVERIAADPAAQVLLEQQWEDGPHRIYAIPYHGQHIAFAHPGLGAPAAVGMLELCIALGMRSFIVCGGCGVLDSGIARGELVVLNAAVRDEGTSYHYLPPAREVAVDADVVHAIEQVLTRHTISYRVGKTWTTDGFYRETRGRIARRKAEGCIVVEMEAAALLAVAHFRGVRLGQIVYGGDDVGGEYWDHRDWRAVGSLRETLFWLSAEACLGGLEA